MNAKVESRKNPKPFGQWVYGRYRRIHRAMRCLPNLESYLASLVEQMARNRITTTNAKLEYHFLVNSIAVIRAEIRSAFRALSDLRKGIERSRITDLEFERGLSGLFAGHREQESIVTRLENSGGLRAYLKRMSNELVRRHDSYTKCLRIVKQSDPDSQDTYGKLAISVWDNLPGGPGEPSVQYSFLCLGGPLGWVATAIVIGAVILLDSDQGGDIKPPDDDDDGDYDSSDPDQGMCYPEPDPVCYPDDYPIPQ